MRKLFAIIQHAEHAAWCWGSCGKGAIASINLGDGIVAMPCFETECPHLDRDDTEPAGEGNFPGIVDDDPYEIWLRKLKPLGTP